MTIRPARAADFDALVALSGRFYAESPHSRASALDADRLAYAVQQTLDHGIVRVLEEHGGGLVGMLGVLPHPLVAGRWVEVAWYLAPEARGGVAAVRLVRDTERHVADVGGSHLQLGAPDDRVGNLLARLGYALAETTYVKELPHS